MSRQNDQTSTSIESTNNPVQKEKLPYVKPELHLLNLDGTEGKSIKGATEYTYTIGGSVYTRAPS